MKQKILVIGTFDTKGEEYAWLIREIQAAGQEVLSLNVGVMGTTDLFPVDQEADAVARAAGSDLLALRAAADRGAAMQVMYDGAAVVVAELYAEGQICGAIGMGGSGGTAVITSGMRALPLGFPKVCISTTASGNVGAYVGTRDLLLFPSVVDVAGINRISRLIMNRAVAALAGMVNTAPPAEEMDRPIVLASMFGNTTVCVDRCRQLLDTAGYEVLVFHAVGSGGRSLEDLAMQGYAIGVLDITTTEWADALCGGIFSAGTERLEGPGKAGIPHLIAPGCIDMVNFGGIETVPAEFRDRKLYEWNPQVTLMRTTAAENAEMGKIFAQKANQAKGPVAFLIPTKGFSVLDSIAEKGQPQLFWDPEADAAFTHALRQHLRADIPVVELPLNINDPAFAARAVEMLQTMMAAAY